MAKMCSKGNEKWNVKISTGKEKKTPKTPKKAAKRKVVIRKQDSCTEKPQPEVRFKYLGIIMKHSQIFFI